MHFARSCTNSLYLAVSYCGNPPEWVRAIHIGLGDKPAESAPELPDGWRIVPVDGVPDAARYD
jgi:hypothetical protein